LMQDDGKTYVFLLQQNIVRKTIVELGEKLGDMMEIKAGLKPGDRIVIKPPKGLKDGSKIKIAER
jgi:multidrug efflux pump subunit AcrA (membrane-fusion protein)